MVGFGRSIVVRVVARVVVRVVVRTVRRQRAYRADKEIPSGGAEVKGCVGVGFVGCPFRTQNPGRYREQKDERHEGEKNRRAQERIGRGVAGVDAGWTGQCTARPRRHTDDGRQEQRT